MNQSTLWKTTLESLQLSLSPVDFNTFFHDTKISKFTEEGENVHVEISTKHGFIASKLENKFHKDIQKSIETFIEKPVTLFFTTHAPLEETPTKDEELGPIFNKPTPKIQKIDKSGLNAQYLFENFVVGNNNQLANAVAMSVAEEPGSYNPFFLHSNVGLGKTHLIHAIGNHIRFQHPEMRVLYCSGETFMNDLINAIRNRTQTKFKKKFRDIDVLLIDDVQSIAGKETTQEELFNTFNSLYMANKQLIFTSDRPPKDIARLEDRLRSRFAGGMIADMQAPDADVRLAILHAKEKQYAHTLSSSVREAIASSITSNIRELEGAFKQIMAVEKTQQRQVSDVEALTLLKKNQPEATANHLTPQKIIKTICDFFAITSKEIKGPSRKKNFVYPRQVAMYLMKELTPLPLMGIGEVLGGRDHTTIMHGIDAIERKSAEDDSIRQQVILIKQQLRV